ncbi:WD40 repeat-like protein [Pisolithus tinctorius]|nr:WD40 repeat-like protein [Pisolithus tinctorius]
MATHPVVFTTKTRYVLPSQKFMIPVEWRRYQLSQLINKALSLADPIPFDFLVHGEILRTSLAQWTAEKGVGEEETLEIEYFESVLPPQRLSSLPHEDWVSSVSCSISQHFLTASYDGHVRLFDHSQNCIRDIPAHLAPVTSVALVSGPNTNDQSYIVASASHDLTARLTKISLADDAARPSQPLATLHLHTSPLTSITADSTGSTLLTASWDGNIGVWDTTIPTEDDLVPESGDRKKRRKTGGNDRPKNKAPATVLKSHTARVSKALFALNSGRYAHSCGFDSTVRHWDVEVGVCTNTITVPERPMLDLSLTNDGNMLLAASTDRTVSIFDLRGSELSSTIGTLMHPATPSCLVCPHTSTAPQVMVGSYDGVARLWDLRSMRSAIASFRVWDGMKILDVDWAGDMLCVGGEGGVDIWRISQGERISATAQT